MRIAETIRSNRATVVAALAVVALAVCAFTFLGSPNGNAAANADAREGASPAASMVALIHDGNGAVQRIPLDQPGDIAITTSLGTNVVRVQNGAASIVEADCPHGDCLNQAAITRPGQQLICLPHKLWVEIVAAGDDGTALDEGAVTWEQGAQPTDAVDVVAR